MIEVKAAQVILVRLSRAAVLRDDHAGNSLDDFARPQERAQRELLVPDHAFIRGSGEAEEAVRAPGHDDGFELHGGCELLGARRTGEAGGD